MEQGLREEIERLHAHLCRGLADPIRIAILYELADGRKNVSQLVNDLGQSQSTVSRHLRILRERELVVADREGTMVYYSLADERIVQALDLLRQVLADRLRQRRRLVEALAR
ncbi:MAG TPA: transcriptional regulator [Anaerolineae bacterium]|nr:transcriptional regulator [Anaerolineae bacterium]